MHWHAVRFDPDTYAHPQLPAAQVAWDTVVTTAVRADKSPALMDSEATIDPIIDGMQVCLWVGTVSRAAC